MFFSLFKNKNNAHIYYVNKRYIFSLISRNICDLSYFDQEFLRTGCQIIVKQISVRFFGITQQYLLTYERIVLNNLYKYSLTF